MFYGTPAANSLHLVRNYFQKYPDDADKVVLSIKGAFAAHTGPTGSAEDIRASVEEALRVLDGAKRIDVFEMARWVSSSLDEYHKLTFFAKNRSQYSSGDLNQGIGRPC